MRPLRLKPICDYTIWGSNTMSKHRKKETNYGTWWEVSAHPYCTNEILNLEQKITLQELIEQDPDTILGKGYTFHELLRLAYLDTQDHLSIQVHPEDNYALTHSNDYGKYESWYIVDAKENATLVAGTLTNDSQIVQKALKDKTIERYLKKWSIKKGDYIIIPSGMLHALGKDILALEIGTNSNTTYRFYDYDRKDQNGNKRELHIKESFEVTDFSLQPTFVEAKRQTRRIAETPFFLVDELYVDEKLEIKEQDHYAILTNLGQDTIILWQNEEILLPQYDSLFLCAHTETIQIKKGAHLLLSNPVKQERGTL